MADDPKKPIDENEHSFKTIEARPVTLTDDFDYFGQKLHRRILSKILVLLIKIVFVYIIGFIFLGFRVKHKEKLYRHEEKRGGRGLEPCPPI